MRKIAFLLAACTLLSLTSCGTPSASQTFTSGELSISLPGTFEIKEEEHLTTLYTDDIKIVIQSTPTDILGDLPFEEYSAFIIESIQTFSPVKIENNEHPAIYEYSLDGNDFADSSCLLSLYKTDKSYFNLTFSCASENYESNQDDFMEWLRSVTFE